MTSSAEGVSVIQPSPDRVWPEWRSRLRARRQKTRDSSTAGRNLSSIHRGGKCQRGKGAGGGGKRDGQATGQGAYNDTAEATLG